ncbi:MAG: GNAT family N-acetyltransferase [Anaerolineae bacterium]|nr:GNAT family N-acetyltransferase [Anaerolineae bacterium]
MIDYRMSLDGITAERLQGFFVGWPDPPSPATHLRILQGSAAIVLAIDESSGQVVGFINAIGDGVHAAFIPNLEVLPAYQHQGIGSELVRRMLVQLTEYYAVDLVCDPDVQSFYERLGMRPARAMVIRRYDRQSGA